MSLWTGQNDAPLSTKDERMAKLHTLDFRDVVRDLEWHEKWPIGEGLALNLNFGERLHIGGAVVIGRTDDFYAQVVLFRFRGKATLREVTARGHLDGQITEFRTQQAPMFTAPAPSPKALP